MMGSCSMLCRRIRLTSPITFASLPGGYVSLATAANAKSKRPPDLFQQTGKKTRDQGGLEAFKAHWSTESVGKSIQTFTTVAAPQFLLHFSGLGVPYFNYFYHPAIPIAMASMLVYRIFHHYNINRTIVLLSLDHSRTVVRYTTGTYRHHFEVPIGCCTYKKAENALVVCGKHFMLNPLGTKDENVLNLINKNMELSGGQDRTKNYIAPFFESLFSVRDLILAICACAAIGLCYLVYGYTDLFYATMKFSGKMQKLIFGRNVTLEKLQFLVLKPTDVETHDD